MDIFQVFFCGILQSGISYKFCNLPASFNNALTVQQLYFKVTMQYFIIEMHLNLLALLPTKEHLYFYILIVKLSQKHSCAYNFMYFYNEPVLSFFDHVYCFLFFSPYFIHFCSDFLNVLSSTNFEVFLFFFFNSFR